MCGIQLILTYYIVGTNRIGYYNIVIADAGWRRLKCEIVTANPSWVINRLPMSRSRVGNRLGYQYLATITGNRTITGKVKPTLWPHVDNRNFSTRLLYTGWLKKIRPRAQFKSPWTHFFTNQPIIFGHVLDTTHVKNKSQFGSSRKIFSCQTMLYFLFYLKTHGGAPLRDLEILYNKCTVTIKYQI